MSHTPGPWTVVDGEIHAGHLHLICFGHDYDDYGGAMGRWQRDDGGEITGAEHKAEVAANLRVMAAAPDLLACVRELAGWVDPEEHGLVNVDEARAVLARALAAIAKAEGQ